MTPETPVPPIPERILDLVQSVDREHDFTDQTRGAEKYFTDCLRDAIVRAGGTARREVPYLDAPTSLRCDLFAEISGRRCYLEVKLLFPTYWSKVQNRIARDRQRLLAPLESFTLPPETHSAARDLEKLATHSLDRPDLLGILVVSSHDEDYDTEPDFVTFARLARLDQPPWVAARRRFPNTHWHQKGGYHLDARVWLCPADEIAGWWNGIKDLYSA